MKIRACAVGQILAGTTALCGLVSLAWADQTVSIGTVGPLTGAYAGYGKDSENGALLAVERVNAAGLTIGGQKITLRLESQDDAGDPRTATQVAQKLVDDKVVAVVGHTNSGTSIPASKVYSDAGIVQISPSATNPAYTQQGLKTTYRVVATDATQGPVLASYAAKKLKLKSVAIIDDSTAYGQGLAQEFERSAKSAGIRVVSHEAANDKTIDFRAVLTKIKGENPDAIMYGGADAGGGTLAKQARQLGLRAKILGGDGLCTEKMVELAGPAVENVVCSEASAALEKMPGGQAFDTAFKARFGHPVQSYAHYAYDSVMVIVDAMKRAGSTDPANILAAMPGTQYSGVTGAISFDSRGDLLHGTISLYDYVGGKRKFLDQVTM
ncbi:branched-chain amino acid ABC transporter substrate-binding protein [Pandoraea terrae]|uniref:Branched-chain amino acid ABC transporter substrate-binding protein n=1 Tax=Pandoraea terrae TaxID=1537710 RepID=A0A5E4ZC31_9BURK|nr:branched-chain amino acid ABC transporter substrate-binding protein [Pandoraea terrae]VVE57733.1 branched-chain amino acid ABC transporter substrate-binding protein [Pandoraea terrae]